MLKTLMILNRPISHQYFNLISHLKIYTNEGSAAMYIVMVLCICPKDNAELIAREVVKKKVAACVYALPGMWGLYGCQDEQCVNDEVTLLILSSEILNEYLYETIIALHPSDKPVIVSLPLKGGYEPYFKCLNNELIQTF